MMPELNMLIGVGDLLKAADLRSFWEAEAMAPASATWYRAPGAIQ
jgi:hypothetical protein